MAKIKLQKSLIQGNRFPRSSSRHRPSIFLQQKLIAELFSRVSRGAGLLISVGSARASIKVGFLEDGRD